MDGCKLSSRMAAEDWDGLMKQIACVLSNASDDTPAQRLRVKLLPVGGHHFFGDFYFVPSSSFLFQLALQGEVVFWCALNKSKTKFGLQRTISQITVCTSDSSPIARTAAEESGVMRSQRYQAWQIKDETDTQIEATEATDAISLNACTPQSQPAQHGGIESAVQHSPTRRLATKLMQPAFSLQSAPTLLETMHSTKLAGRCDDCLRPDCVAWLEGNPLPQPLGELKVGQRVLCHDHLTHGMKYAEITNVVIEAGSAEWVKVVLEDGTALEMTANHPTQPASVRGQNGICPAGQLQAGKDYLMVLKTMPVLVKEVQKLIQEPLEGEKKADERVFLTLKQPERHAVFVAARDSAGGIAEVHTIAVGSADVQSRSKRVTVKNTFLEITEGSANAQVSPTKNRSSSVPRSFKLSGIAMESRNFQSAPVVLCSYRTSSSGIGAISNGCQTGLVTAPLQVTPASAHDQLLDDSAMPMETRKSAPEVLCSYRTASSFQSELSNGCKTVLLTSPLQVTPDRAHDQVLDDSAMPLDILKSAPEVLCSYRTASSGFSEINNECKMVLATPPLQVTPDRAHDQVLDDSAMPLDSLNSGPEVLCSYRTASSGFSEINNGCKMVLVPPPLLVAPPLQVTSVCAPDQQLDYSATPRSSQQGACSELQNTHANGFASIGSALHAKGICIPCLFHSRSLYEGGSPCWKGSSCERCHEDHGKQERRKPATGRARARLKKQKQEDGIPCLD